MEPVIAYNLFTSLDLLGRACHTLTERCIMGITANREICRRMVEHSIGLVTALNPYIGYEKSTEIANLALATGDSVYEIVLEKVMPLEAGEDLPRCIGGKNAGPPDDCGGVWGYANLLDALKDEDHDNHDYAVEVLGKKFNPEAFDPEEVNRQLKKVFKPAKKPKKSKKKPGAGER